MAATGSWVSLLRLALLPPGLELWGLAVAEDGRSSLAGWGRGARRRRRCRRDGQSEQLSEQRDDEEDDEVLEGDDGHEKVVGERDGGAGADVWAGLNWSRCRAGEKETWASAISVEDKTSSQDQECTVGSQRTRVLFDFRPPE